MHFEAAQFGAWLAVMAGQAVLLILLLRHRNRSFRIFSAYAFTQLAFPLIGALLVEQYPLAYFFAYYACTVTAGVLVLFSALEIYRRVFGPRRALPAWVPEKTAVMVGISLLAGIVFAILMRVSLGGPWTRIMVKLEQALAIGGWASFAILGVYSKSLLIPWRDRAVRIAVGFMLYLSVDMVTVFIRSRSPELAIAAGTAGQIAYLLAVIWWCVSLRAPEPATEMTSEEILNHQPIEALLAN